MIGAFWSAVAVLAATYAGVPALLLLLGRVGARPHRRSPVEPTVSIVVAARNEVDAIGAKLDRLLELDWPPDRLEIVVVSDGSDDGTDEVVRGYADRGVQLLRQDWDGKAAALERGVAASTGEVLVFTDANSLLEPGALKALTRSFADPDVGGVAGNQRYLDGDAAGAAAGERGYWALDRLMKRAQSSSGDVISATGALYAIRREHFHGVAVGVTDDFYVSTGVIVDGRRLVFEPEAVAWEPVAKSTGHEFGRKVRVMTRGFRAVIARRELLDPRRYGRYALQLWWHKVLRRLMVFPLLVLAGTAPFLWRRGRVYRWATAAQAGFYGAAVAGLVLPERPARWRRLLGLPAYFVMVNAASLRAVVNILTGRRIERWQPARR